MCAPPFPVSTGSTPLSRARARARFPALTQCHAPRRRGAQVLSNESLFLLAHMGNKTATRERLRREIMVGGPAAPPPASRLGALACRDRTPVHEPRHAFTPRHNAFTQ